MKKEFKNLLAIVLIIIVVVVAVILYHSIVNGTNQKPEPVDRSWFDGTWLNSQSYTSTTIQLHFYNVFDDVIIYHNKTNTNTTWYPAEISKFEVFTRENIYTNFKANILYFSTPLNLFDGDNGLYLCSIWNENKVFEIYYGDQHMRFYKQEP